MSIKRGMLRNCWANQMDKLIVSVVSVKSPYHIGVCSYD